ncbi:hypothetical protein [Paraburkholderia caffeinilytica]|uniref:hypothetical protein n=1 Tax=Paraburkholderia caffeinilytica TaxID=1761016 RepID=UPI003DA102BC
MKKDITYQSAMLAHMRDFVTVAIFGELPKKKKAMTDATAPKGVSEDNHTPWVARLPLH